MSQDHKDWDILLREMRQKEPTQMQKQHWKKAIKNEIHLSKVRSPLFSWQLVAASLVGFLLGASIFGWRSSEFPIHVAQNDIDNATIEYVFTKTN